MSFNPLWARWTRGRFNATLAIDACGRTFIRRVINSARAVVARGGAGGLHAGLRAREGGAHHLSWRGENRHHGRRRPSALRNQETARLRLYAHRRGRAGSEARPADISAGLLSGLDLWAPPRTGHGSQRASDCPVARATRFSLTAVFAENRVAGALPASWRLFHVTRAQHMRLMRKRIGRIRRQPNGGARSLSSYPFGYDDVRRVGGDGCRRECHRRHRHARGLRLYAARRRAHMGALRGRAAGIFILQVNHAGFVRRCRWRRHDGFGHDYGLERSPHRLATDSIAAERASLGSKRAAHPSRAAVGRREVDAGQFLRRQQAVMRYAQ